MQRIVLALQNFRGSLGSDLNGITGKDSLD